MVEKTFTKSAGQCLGLCVARASVTLRQYVTIYLSNL